MPSKMLISPAQAAEIIGVSRRTIMRAIETHDLQAFRDNKNHWKIEMKALNQWKRTEHARSEHAHSEASAISLQDMAIALGRAEAERDALREQLEQTKEDRDHWRGLAARQQLVLTSARSNGFWKRLLWRSPSRGEN